MQLTSEQKTQLIDLLKQVDVKKLEIDDLEISKQKWFRFGSYQGLAIASEIIKQIPEAKSEQAQDMVS